MIDPYANGMSQPQDSRLDQSVSQSAEIVQ
jgi:hypothetical protein